MHVRMAVFAASIIPVLIGVGAGAAIAMTANDPKNAPVFILVGVIVGALVGRPIAKVANRWSIRRLDGVTSSEDAEITISVDDDGVHYKSPVATSHTLWSGIDRVIDSQGAIFLITGMGVHFVPARCFASDAERLSLLAFANARLSKKARRKQ